MKFMKGLFYTSIILSLCLLHQAEAEASDHKKAAKMLFESKCQLCHAIERPKSKRKTKSGWETTVMRMKNQNGGPITDEQAIMIIEYLADEYGPEK